MIIPLHLQKPNILMRKLLALLCTLFILMTTHGQLWFDIGFKGGIGPGLIMNQNIWDDPDYNHRLTASNSYGAKFGLNFNDEHEITFDFMISNFHQDFLHNEYDSITSISPLFKSNLSYGSFDYMLLYRHNKDGRYLEVGPSIQQIRSIVINDEYRPSYTSNIEHVNQLQTNMIFGFGAYFMGSENFGITTGFRATYNISDMVSENGKVNNLPNLKSYPIYKPSHPLTLCFIMEANFDFAYIAKAQCSRRKLIFF